MEFPADVTKSVAIVFSADGTKRTVRGDAKLESVRGGCKVVRIVFGLDQGNASLVIEQDAWRRLEPRRDDACDYLLELDGPHASSSAIPGEA